MGKMGRLQQLAVFGVLLATLPIQVAASRIPEGVKDTVVFVLVPGAKCPKPTEPCFQPIGSGFLVGIPDWRDGSRTYIYLVTARHVLQTVENGPYLKRVFLRFNTRSGGSEVVEVPLVTEGKGKTLFVDRDASVDLAAVPIVLDSKVLDFRILGPDIITTKQQFADLKIAEGSEVFFAGLFASYPGETRNYPIVRFGRVALVTPEKINWNGVMTDLYLVEVGSYGGNSGSPVFFSLGMDRVPNAVVMGPPEIHLAGVMKGFFTEQRPLSVVETARTPAVDSNTGIAAVVPAFKLQELLFGDELSALRRR